MAGENRTSWLDEEGGVGLEESARKLGSFLEAMADGVISDDEVAAQERRVVELMKSIEPKLDDELHEEVTRLLVELTAYDIMKLLGTMQAASVKTKFKG
jgi:hypothetical protein